MQWSTVVANFEIQHKALKDAIKKDPPTIPKLKKNGVVTKWIPSFVTAITHHFGARDARLRYLIRDDAVVPAVAPPLAPGMPHSVEGGSIIADMESRLSHTHTLYQLDNEMLFASLDEAIHDSEFFNTIKPFERTRNGRGAYLALMGNHAGDDKWDRIIETADTYINRKRWDGTGDVTLEHHMDKLKSAYIEMEAGAEHVDHQIPSPRTRVKSFLKSIERCTDPAIQAVIVSIRNEVNGLATDFAESCRLLVPCCPVAKRYANKRQNAQISSTNGYYGDGQDAPGKEYIPNQKGKDAGMVKPRNVELFHQEKKKKKVTKTFRKIQHKKLSRVQRQSRSRFPHGLILFWMKKVGSLERLIIFSVTMIIYLK